jgi:hypothetical protein
MAKRSQPVDREKLVEDLHRAVRAFVEGNGGKLSVVGPIELVPHKALVFDLVIHCVGQRSKWTSQRRDDDSN